MLHALGSGSQHYLKVANGTVCTRPSHDRISAMLDTIKAMHGYQVLHLTIDTPLCAAYGRTTVQKASPEFKAIRFTRSCQGYIARSSGLRITGSMAMKLTCGRQRQVRGTYCSRGTHAASCGVGTSSSGRVPLTDHTSWTPPRQARCACGVTSCVHSPMLSLASRWASVCTAVPH